MNNMSTFSRDREVVQRQLVQAKETLTKLRALNDTQNAGKSGDLVPPGRSLDRAEDFDSPRDLRRDAMWDERNGYENKSTGLRPADKARDNLVKVLGLQVTKMEDDLKISLLAYFEQVERQKEDLINSFELMHQQLLKHQDTWQENQRESEEKDALIQRLKTSNEALQNEMQKQKQNMFSSSSFPHENRQRFFPRGPDDHFIENANDELYENLLKENSYLRDRLREHESRDQARQRQLYDSYDKDVSKDVLIKRLQAENRAMREDIQDLQSELLRRNAGRLSAEKDVAKVNQEMQFCEEQIRCLRDKLQQATEEKQYLEQTIKEAKGKASACDDNLSLLENEIVDLREKCDSYRDKIHDKEDFVASIKKENLRLGKIIDALKKELSSARNEAQTLRSEGERLHEEVAEREIGRLNSETNTKASSTKIKQLKEQLHEAEMKAVELAEACSTYEEREARMNQETLAAIEKYTQVEQELFMAKKELSHVRGFYDGTEKRRKELQGEIENLRKENISLQEQLKSNNKMEVEKQELSGEQKAKLKEHNTELQEEIESLNADIGKLEQALDSAREHNSVQRMRLEGMETMMSRKDERIKELQGELVEHYNQNDSLTGELLEKNREAENLKLSMMMLEQELESSKTGRTPVRTTRKDSSSFYTGEPATPDSGYVEMDREKAIEKLSKDMLSDHTKQSSGQAPNIESGFHTIDEALNEEAGEETASECEQGPTLSELTAENEDIRRKETELRNAVDELQQQLLEAAKENENLKVRERELEEALESAKKQPSKEAIVEEHCARIACATEEDEQVLPDEYFSNLSTVPEETDDYVNPTQIATQLETVPEETWTDLENATETVDGRQGTARYLEEENERLQDKIGQLEDTIKGYDSTLEDLTEERDGLSKELDQARESLQRIGTAVVEREREKDELQGVMEDEIAIKDEEISKLQKELSSLDEKYENSTKTLKNAEETRCEYEQELLNVQARNLELDKERKKHRARVEDVEKFLEQDEQFTANLQAELGEALGRIRSTESENTSLKQTIELAQQDSELEKEKLEEKIEENSRAQREADENLTALFNENQELQHKLQATQEDIRELQEARQHEMEAAKLDSQNALKLKQQKIDELQDELAHSKEKLEELKLIWDNSHDERSDLKNELLEAKERIYAAATANDILVRRGNELEQSLFEKEEQAETLRAENDKARKDLKEREQRLEDLSDKLEQLHENIGVVGKENDGLKEAIQDLKLENTELQKLVANLEEEKKIVEEELQEAYESISDLERAFEKSEDERTETEGSLEEAERKITGLEEDAKTAEKRVKDLEKECASSEDNLQSLRTKLLANEEKADDLKSQLELAKEKLAVLEEVNDQSQGKEHLLHERLLNALNKVNEIEAEYSDAKEKQHTLEADVMQLQLRREALEKEKQNADEIRKETEEELMSFQGDVSALQEDLDAKQVENEELLLELKQLKNKLAEAEQTHKRNIEEKEILKEKTKEALGKVSELETSTDTKQNLIEELEDLLQRTMEKERGLEERLKTSTRTNDDLLEKLEGFNNKLRASNDDCSCLERKLKKQKDTIEGLKKELAKKEEKILNLSYGQDSAESALQSVKKDLAKKEGKLKLQKEHLEQAQLDLDQANRKTKELDAANRKVCRENDNILREMHDMRDKVARLENSNAQKEALVNRLESTLLKGTNEKIKKQPSDDRLRNWGDKLSIAQIKLADLENELAKDIRRHELRSMRARPLSALSGSSDGSDTKRRETKKLHFPQSKENSFDSQKTDELLLIQSDSESVDPNDKRNSKANSSRDRSSQKTWSSKDGDAAAREDMAPVHDRTDESTNKQNISELDDEQGQTRLQGPNIVNLMNSLETGDSEIPVALARGGEDHNISVEGTRSPATEDLLHSGDVEHRERTAAVISEAAIPTWERQSVEEVRVEALICPEDEILDDIDDEGMTEEAIAPLENQEKHYSAPSQSADEEFDDVDGEQNATGETLFAPQHTTIPRSRPISDPEIEQGNSLYVFTKSIQVESEPIDCSLGLPPGELLRSDSSMTSVTDLTTHRSSEFDLDEEAPFMRHSPREAPENSPTGRPSGVSRENPPNEDTYCTNDVTTDVIDPFTELMGNSTLVPPDDYVDDDVMDPFAELMTYSSLAPPSNFVSSEAYNPFEKFEEELEGDVVEIDSQDLSRGILREFDDSDQASLFRQPLVPKKEACKISNVVSENEYESHKKPSDIRKQLEKASRIQTRPEKPQRAVMWQNPAEITSRAGKFNEHSETSEKPRPKPRTRKAEKHSHGEGKQGTPELISPEQKDTDQEDPTEKESVFDLIAAFEGRRA